MSLHSLEGSLLQIDTLEGLNDTYFGVISKRHFRAFRGSKELVLGVPNSSGSRNLIVVMDFEMTQPNVT